MHVREPGAMCKLQDVKVGTIPESWQTLLPVHKVFRKRNPCLNSRQREPAICQHPLLHQSFLCRRQGLLHTAVNIKLNFDTEDVLLCKSVLCYSTTSTKSTKSDCFFIVENESLD